MNRFEFMQDLITKSDGGVDSNKAIVALTFVVSAIVLIVAAYRNSPDLWIIFGIFMSTGYGLKVSKGIVDLKREQIEIEADKARKGD